MGGNGQAFLHQLAAFSPGEFARACTLGGRTVKRVPLCIVGALYSASPTTPTVEFNVLFGKGLEATARVLQFLIANPPAPWRLRSY